jgi:hypothetical protein
MAMTLFLSMRPRSGYPARPIDLAARSVVRIVVDASQSKANDKSSRPCGAGGARPINGRRQLRRKQAHCHADGRVVLVVVVMRRKQLVDRQGLCYWPGGITMHDATMGANCMTVGSAGPTKWRARHFILCSTRFVSLCSTRFVRLTRSTRETTETERRVQCRRRSHHRKLLVCRNAKTSPDRRAVPLLHLL